tara:strand:+ start:127687 stop:127965 length:279 start_codon:yes stop_codon:yes gene_type:complete
MVNIIGFKIMILKVFSGEICKIVAHKKSFVKIDLPNHLYIVFLHSFLTKNQEEKEASQKSYNTFHDNCLALVASWNTNFRPVKWQKKKKPPR